MSDVKSDIKKTVFSVPADSDGWTLELNFVSWYGREPKWDLRKWNEDHTKSGRGCTMSEDEVVLLFQRSDEILEAITGEKVVKRDDKPEESSENELPFE